MIIPLLERTRRVNLQVDTADIPAQDLITKDNVTVRVGSPGYEPVGRLVHGSVSQKLARTARCALLVFPRGADRADAPEASDRDADESPVAGTVK